MNFIKNLKNIQTEVGRLLETNEIHDISYETIHNSLLKKYKDLRVLLKLGHKGCHYISNTLDLKLPPVPEFNPKIINDLFCFFENILIINDYKIVDTTGAGDGFTAAFFVKYKELICKLINY